MARTAKDPAGRVAASASRALEIVFTDADQDTTAGPFDASPAAHWVAVCFLTPRRAALVASLAGLGAAAVPMPPALIGGAR